MSAAFLIALLIVELAVVPLRGGDYNWNNPAGGIFSEKDNWTPSDGPPVADDYVTFNLDGNYAVGFSENAASTSIFVRNDQAMFLLVGYEYTVTYNTVVGWYGGENGRLELVDGLLTTDSMHVGHQGTATGALILSDHATLEVADLLDIANTNDTNAHVSVEECSSLSCATMVIGGDLNATGSLQVTGPGSTFACSGEITVGNLARGVMLIEQGANTASASAVIGSGNDPGQVEKALGNVVVSDNGSRWINVGSLTVGYTGTAEGSMAVANGAYVENQAATLGVETDARGMVVVEGAGATWKCNSLLTIGLSGSSTMAVSFGGGISTAGTDIAALAGSTGSVSLSGAGTTWNESLDLNVGGTTSATGGSGSLSVASDAVLSVAGELRLHDNSSLTIDAGTVNAGTFIVSENAAFDFNNGTLTVAGGGFTCSTAAGMTIDGDSSSALPTLRLVDAAIGATGPLLAVASGNRGAMEIRGGSTITADEGAIGVNTDSQGSVTVADPGSQWQIGGTLRVGDSGSAELEIRDGASVQATETFIGCNSGADGNITVAGNDSALVCDNLDVGGSSAGLGGTAALAVLSGGSVEVHQELNVWSSATIVLDGGIISVGGLFNCDGDFDFSAGTLSVGQIACAADKFDFTGGTLNITGADLLVGDSGPLGNSLELASGRHVNVAQQAVVESGSSIRVDRGASLTANEIRNYGELELTGNTAKLSGTTLMNIGLIQGNGRIEAVLQNHPDGQMRVELGNRIVVDTDSTLSTNLGTIDMAGGTFECTQAFLNSSTGFIAGRGTLRFGGQLQNDAAIVLSGGFSDIHGDVANDDAGSTIVITGGAVATFYDDVHSDGLIRVSADCSAVFLGEFSGTGGTSGTGTVYLEGDLRPGNSPAEVSFGGDLMLGNSASLDIELAGSEPGSEHDVIDVASVLSLGGELNVTFIDGFSPSPSQTFDILEFSETSGSFDQINLPSLSSRLEWDTSWLYTTGELALIYDPFPGDANRDGAVDHSDA
ncbi:MAG: hypothetical protein U9N87_01390, partial [Planctomycetota bacterium]|nr:hypothetical protein [Planctomycetota bacterium]